MKAILLFVFLSALLISCGKEKKSNKIGPDPRKTQIGVEKSSSLKVYDASLNGPIRPKDNQVEKFSFIFGETNKENNSIDDFSPKTHEVYVIRDVDNGECEGYGRGTTYSSLFLTTIGNPYDSYFIDLGEGECPQVVGLEDIKKDFFHEYQGKSQKLKVKKGHCYFYHSFNENAKVEGIFFLSHIKRFNGKTSNWNNVSRVDFILHGPHYLFPYLGEEKIEMEKVKLLFLERNYDFWQSYDLWR